MFDRLEILTREDDPRPSGTGVPDARQPGKMRDGHRREYDPRNQERQSFEDRSERALADVGMYRTVSFRDLADARFGGHPYTTRRAVNRWIKDGAMREHEATGPQGGSYKVLTLTRAGARQARQLAQDQGLDKGQQTWSGLVKRGELGHDTAVYRAARRESARLLEQGATIRRVRIDAEMKKQVARAAETARAREGKAAADAARWKAAEELSLPVEEGRVVYPDAQIEYRDTEGRTGRVNVEVASEHYRSGSIVSKAAAGFEMHGNGGRATANIQRALGSMGGGGEGGGGGRGQRDQGSIEL